MYAEVINHALGFFSNELDFSKSVSIIYNE